MNWLRALLLGVLAAAAPAAPDFVWIEGENPTAKNMEIAPAPWGNPQFSQGAWLVANLEPSRVEKELPKEGLLLGYDFRAASAGKYEVWNRIGYEFVRSPFEWRVDQGAWQAVRPQDLTTDLTEVGEWTEIAWLKMGDADLAAGAHTLQIRLMPTYVEKNGKQELQRVFFASDCFCIHKGAFQPNGRFQPGQDWQSDQDKQAAAHVFEVKAAAGPERVETSLAGLWQVCRYDEMEVVDRTEPTKTLPDVQQAFWTSIPVPGNKSKQRPDLAFAHRLVYRTKVNVPAEMAGRSFFLRFPSINLIAGVHVNGRFCGGTKAPYALWECDITPAVRAGQANDVCVVIKDSYYAFSEKKSGKNARYSFNIPTTWMGDRNYVSQNFDFPIGSHYAAASGILETPSLVVAGTAYTTDVFAIPSVRKKELGLEVTLLNPTAAERKVQLVNEVVPALGTTAEKSFAPQDVTLAPGAEQVVKLAEPWESPKLWWPDEPNLYYVVTKVLVDGQVTDVRRTRFGFREWEWSGAQFKLNGVPWQLWADTTRGDGGKDPEEAIAFWRKSGQNMWRFWGQQFGGLNKEQALDFMDTHGVPVRRSGIFDGQGANYLHKLADGPELFDNWITQMKAWIREERNHPSVLIWSLENEITFINSRNLGLAQRVEPEIARGAREVMALDPTRPVMVDGGNCLTDNSLPVNGVHYMESHWRDYPDEAYTLDKAYRAHQEALLPTWGKNQWQLVPDRPIFMGESYYLRGNKPADFAQFGGEGCFAGWGPHTRKGGGLLAKMLAEGYRWHGMAAHHFWLGSEDCANIHHNSWQPVCILCREWNWTFASGSQVTRTLKVFNDTRHADPIEATWRLLVNGKPVAGAVQTLQLAPGEHREMRVSFSVPKVAARTAAQFVLLCRRGGKELFRETKAVALIDPNAGPKPKLAKADLVVLDPAGSVTARLKARGVAFTEVASAAAIPAKARVVVIGKDSLSPREATDPRWISLVGNGARLLVLDQQSPLRHLAVPADLRPTDYVGRVAFSENIAHPVFAGLDQPDFFTWSKDHVVYRNVYQKATRGALSLAHCDDQLNYTALAECQVNDGLMMLCQLVVGEKLATDPVAQRLFDNMLAYCASYAPVRLRTAVVMDDAVPAAKLLAESGLKYDKAPDVLSAIGGKHEVVVFDATPANLKALAGAPAKVKAFTDAGGWLMAWGVAPEGLADFNRLVGVEHVLRPFELERVTLPAVRDPLLSGLTVRDVALEGSERIFSWAGGNYMVDDEFSHVVDLDDIAPFCEFPGAKAGDGAAAKQAVANWSRNAVNGFTSADAWKLIYYMASNNAKLAIKLPRPEEITDLGIVLNTHYCKATKVNLYYDDDPNPVTLTTKPNDERQDFALAPRKASRLTIELAAYDNQGVTTGIDNLWIKARRPDDWYRKVKPLLNIGGLVKYQMGKGGVILNQLLIKGNESVPVNAQKKRAVVTTLLRNLHATFAGGRVLTTGNLQFQPIALHEQCNQYLNKERGWVNGNRDLAHLPVGTNDFAGVPFAVRDFRTSPLTSCVMLAGPGAKGQLPNEVKGLKAECSADVLYFLHTMNRAQEWRGRPNEAPPVLFRYVVHYQDGQTAEVPVIYGEGVGHWISAQPAGLKSAAVAWAAPFPGEDTKEQKEQAVVYQFPWTNPRPEAAIQSIDMLYGPSGSRFGTPALLAVTAAKAK